MSWAKLDDQFHSHPKVFAAGNEAVGLWARMLSWSAQHLTDGVVPREVAIFYAKNDEKLIEKLVEVGLFDLVGEHHLGVHDYLKYNPTAKKTKRKRKADLARKAKGRAQRSKRVRAESARNPDGILEDSARNPQNFQTESAQIPDVPYPYPYPYPYDVSDRGKRPARNPDGILADAPTSTHTPQFSELLSLGDLETACYARYGQMKGTDVPALAALCPVAQWEVDAVLKTKGKSWGYAIKVLRSMREEANQPPPPPAGEKPTKSKFVNATKRAMEWANEQDAADRVCDADGEAAIGLPECDPG